MKEISENNTNIILNIWKKKIWKLQSYKHA